MQLSAKQFISDRASAKKELGTEKEDEESALDQTGKENVHQTHKWKAASCLLQRRDHNFSLFICHIIDFNGFLMNLLSCHLSVSTKMRITNDDSLQFVFEIQTWRLSRILLIFNWTITTRISRWIPENNSNWYKGGKIQLKKYWIPNWPLTFPIPLSFNLKFFYFWTWVIFLTVNFRASDLEKDIEKL